MLTLKRSLTIEGVWVSRKCLPVVECCLMSSGTPICSSGVWSPFERLVTGIYDDGKFTKHFCTAYGKWLMKLASIFFSHDTLCNLWQEMLLFKLPESEVSKWLMHSSLGVPPSFSNKISKKQFRRNQLPERYRVQPVNVWNIRRIWWGLRKKRYHGHRVFWRGKFMMTNLKQCITNTFV